MKTITLMQLLQGQPMPAEPFAIKHRSADIPQQIVGMINNAPAHCRAIGLNVMGGRKMIIAAERAARRRGIRILWRDHGLPATSPSQTLRGVG